MPDEHTTPTSDPSEPRKFVDYKDTFWVWLLERLGLPTLLVIAGMYAVDKVAGWVAPRVDKVVNKHVDFMDQTEVLQRDSLDIQKQNRDIHREQANILERVIKSQDGTSVVTDEHRRLTLEIRDDVKEIKSAVSPRGTRPAK